MKLQSLFSLVSILALTLSCSGDSGRQKVTMLEDPSDLYIESGSDDWSGTLHWKDNATNEKGYYVFIVREGTMADEPTATLPAGSTSYSFEKLTPGWDFMLGVQAYGEDYSLSKLVWCPKIFATPAYAPNEDPQENPDPDPNPIDAISFTWTEVTGLDLPSSVKVYKTEGKLNDRPVQAWYAVADCTGDISFRVMYPGEKNHKTLDTQAQEAGNCLVLVNGGIFGGSGKPNGLAVCDGTQTPWFRVEDDNWDVDRQYWGPDGKLHTVSRGLFGVDTSGKPGVYWSYTPSHGTVYVYDQPIPSVAGGPVQPGGTDTFPCDRAQWVPYNAITCGPVLLQNGRCPITSKKNSQGYWETNYEMWADDIYGVDQLHDRTSVGFLPDGRIILCVVDGRIETSKGATTLEMAAIMKGLGCEGALNLDGGGSTGMWAAGQHLNDMTDRKILTTIGFFKK